MKRDLYNRTSVLLMKLIRIPGNVCMNDVDFSLKRRKERKHIFEEKSTKSLLSDFLMFFDLKIYECLRNKDFIGKLLLILLKIWAWNATSFSFFLLRMNLESRKLDWKTRLLIFIQVFDKSRSNSSQIQHSVLWSKVLEFIFYSTLVNFHSDFSCEIFMYTRNERNYLTQ